MSTANNTRAMGMVRIVTDTTTTCLRTTQRLKNVWLYIESTHEVQGYSLVVLNQPDYYFKGYNYQNMAINKFLLQIHNFFHLSPHSVPSKISFALIGYKPRVFQHNLHLLVVFQVFLVFDGALHAHGDLFGVGYWRWSERWDVRLIDVIDDHRRNSQNLNTKFKQLLRSWRVLFSYFVYLQNITSRKREGKHKPFKPKTSNQQESFNRVRNRGYNRTPANSISSSVRSKFKVN